MAHLHRNFKTLKSQLLKNMSLKGFFGGFLGNLYRESTFQQILSLYHDLNIFPTGGFIQGDALISAVRFFLTSALIRWGRGMLLLGS